MERQDLGMRRAGRLGRGVRQAVALVASLALVLAPLAWADRTPIKPGWNMFSPQQDVEVGQQVSRDAERQLPMLNDRRVDDYVSNVGRRLAAHVPGERYPFRFRVVNDQSINAFALPGGPVYINRGVIETADNEAQLAGVMAHEMSHVALRHGTNQASKAYVAQVPLAILGGVLGSNSVGAVLAQVGAGFAANSILLKYSRTAESQADIMGTQILYDSGYDPRAMAQFFEKIETGSKGSHPVEFFSNHPSPDHRVERVTEEVDKLGGAPRGYRSDSAEFEDIKRYVRSLPQPPKGRQRLQGGDRNDGTRRGTRPDWPSDRLVPFENALLRVDYPDNWQAYSQGDAATIAPRNGLVDDGRGNGALAYGMIVNIYEPHYDRYDQQLQGRGYGGDQGISLEEATDQLVQEFRQTNRNMRVTRYHESIRVDGQRALSSFLSNDSPIGGRETDWLITMQRPEGGLLFMVFTAPDRDWQDYDTPFREMLRSVRIRR